MDRWIDGSMFLLRSTSKLWRCFGDVCSGLCSPPPAPLPKPALRNLVVAPLSPELDVSVLAKPTNAVSPDAVPPSPCRPFPLPSRLSVAVVLLSSLQEVRTEAVFQTPDPVFERTWVFVASSYDACVTIDLVDASNDRPAGRFETTVMAVLQVSCETTAGLDCVTLAGHFYA